MKVLPVTNPQIHKSPNFKNANLLKNSASVILHHPDMLRNEQMGAFNVIYKDLAKLDYADKINYNDLIHFFRYATRVFKLKDNMLRADLAIQEGIRNNNPEFLKVVMQERELLPYNLQGDIDIDVILEGRGHQNPEIRKFFTDEFLEKRAINREYLDMEEQEPAFELYDYSAMQSRDKFFAEYSVGNPETHLANAKKRISFDEDSFGLIKINTIDKIVDDIGFNSIKNASLDLSGNKILHLLAEININPDTDMPVLKNILRNCKRKGYNFKITNDFGETALDKAREAENNILIKKLEEIERDKGFYYDYSE